MMDIIVDTLMDTLKIIPFLFIVFLFMELLEHKFSKKSKEAIEKSGKLGPIIGSVFGCIPQCGFSVAATNLYAGRIITYGTLISVYLSTSDEMLPILISESAPLSVIFKIIGIKVVIGMICGFVIDLIIRKHDHHEHVHDMCKHCGCDESILKSVIKHTINISLFILIINFALNGLIEYIGEEKISHFLLKNTIFEPFLTSLVGLIPNCASSVILTELYLSKTITLGAAIAGLLTKSGVALVVLFKQNKNAKENIKTIILMYLIGVVFGIVLSLLHI